MSAIKLENVSIYYPLPDTSGYNFKRYVFDTLLGNTPPPQNQYCALKNITLNINEGERVGIIGLNGAGKSTFLKTLSGIYPPSEGRIEIHGKVSPLLDFTTGFEEHHTGYENIIIRLMFLGESKQSAQKKLPDIINFADLGEFLHRPARTYSTGMLMRLAFAVSTAIEPQILVADEVIGAGDLKFAEKANRRLDNLLMGNRTTVISSHSFGLVRKYCDRAIWLEAGEVALDGDVETVLSAYEKASLAT